MVSLEGSFVMGSMLAFLGRDMAVDLGTANTLVYVRRRGIALNEPSVVALNTHTGKIVALGGIVTSESIRVGGDKMDHAVIAFVKKEYSLMLGERTAEEIKMAIGSACPSPQEPHTEIRGRDLVSGLPKTVVISGGEVRHAIAEPVSAVVDIVKTTLDKCPPELAGDVMDRGIALTGGGARPR